METRLQKLLGKFLIAILLMGFPPSIFAQEYLPITIEEALERVFTTNSKFAIFVEEQNLNSKRERQNFHPKVGVVIQPGKIENGTLQGPQGSITMEIPLKGGLKLSGGLSGSLEQKVLDFKPSGSLTLKYDLLVAPSASPLEAKPEEQLMIEQNNLVISTLELLSQLRKGLDAEKLNQEKLIWLQNNLDAAKLVPDYDDSELQLEMEKLKGEQARLQRQNASFQLEFAHLLGLSEHGNYSPVLELDLEYLVLSREFEQGDYLAFNPLFQKAQADLKAAQASLSHKQKTRGWSMEATGEIDLQANWNLGIVANKQLYPQRIILEELNLELQKARLVFVDVKRNLKGQFQESLQVIKDNQAQLDFALDKLGEIEQDMDLQQRRLKAGLVTDLQVAQGRLTLLEQQMEVEHKRVDYILSVFRLWQACGYDLLVSGGWSHVIR